MWNALPDAVAHSRQQLGTYLLQSAEPLQAERLARDAVATHVSIEEVPNSRRVLVRQRRFGVKCLEILTRSVSEEIAARSVLAYAF